MSRSPAAGAGALAAHGPVCRAARAAAGRNGSHLAALRRGPVLQNQNGTLSLGADSWKNVHASVRKPSERPGNPRGSCLHQIELASGHACFTGDAKPGTAGDAKEPRQHHLDIAAQLHRLVFVPPMERPKTIMRQAMRQVVCGLCEEIFSRELRDDRYGDWKS